MRLREPVPTNLRGCKAKPVFDIKASHVCLIHLSLDSISPRSLISICLLCFYDFLECLDGFRLGDQQRETCIWAAFGSIWAVEKVAYEAVICSAWVAFASVHRK